MLRYMRYFQIGKAYSPIVNEKDQFCHYGQIKYLVPKYKEHGLQNLMSNDIFLKKYFVNNILSESCHGMITKESMFEEDEIFEVGQMLSRNIFNQINMTHIPSVQNKKTSDVEFFDLVITENDIKKKYKSKRPIELLHNRIHWFLSVSPFVKNFNIEKLINGYNFHIEYL